MKEMWRQGEDGGKEIKKSYISYFSLYTILYLTIVNIVFYQFIPKFIPTLFDYRIPYNTMPIHA